MADLDLRVDYQDDILDSSVNTKRKYNIIENEDGTKSLEDVSVYTQNGDSFGAADINKTNQAVLDLNSSLTRKVLYDSNGITITRSVDTFCMHCTEANVQSVINEYKKFMTPTGNSLIYGFFRIGGGFYYGYVNPYTDSASYFSGTNLLTVDKTNSKFWGNITCHFTK